MSTVKRGKCHCGAVEFEVELENGLENVRRCNCSLCRRKGAIMAGVPLERLRVVKGADMLTLYQWNTRRRRNTTSARSAASTRTISDAATRLNTASTSPASKAWTPSPWGTYRSATAPRKLWSGLKLQPTATDASRRKFRIGFWFRDLRLSTSWPFARVTKQSFERSISVTRRR